MKILMGISFLILALVYIVTIALVRHLLKQIDEDRCSEMNHTVSIICEYKREMKYLKAIVRQLSGMQYCGNKDICLRRIENELKQFEIEMTKKEELSNNLASDR